MKKTPRRPDPGRLAARPACPRRQHKVTFKDPAGDDNGPGTYKYPTDAVYKEGSFDLTEFNVDGQGQKVDFTVGVNM